MDSAKIMAKIKIAQSKALTVAAKYLLGEVMPFVPIDTGALRRSGKVIDGEDGSVSIKFGNEKTEKYAGFQYGSDTGEFAQFHNFTNGAMSRMLELIETETRLSSKGKTGKRRYSAAYRDAKDSGKLTRFPRGSRWFDIVLFDEEVQRRAWYIYAQAFRGVR